jgi:hypothetical protein
MKTSELEDISTMSLDDAKVELAKRVLSAALFLESLERAGKIGPGGRRQANGVARFATKLLEQGWKE